MTRADTLRLKYGADYFVNLGRKGGKKSTSRPFTNPEIASKAGKKSKRKKVDTGDNSSV